MAGNHWDVEQIVREVLRRLQGREEQRDAKRENGRTTAAIAADGRLVVSDRVVGMHSLDGRLEGVRRLIVPHRAVLTPLVRDELNGRGIAVEQVAQPDKTCEHWILATVTSQIQPVDAARSVWAGLREPAWRIDRTDLPDAINELVNILKKQPSLALLLTRYPDVAVCLANRSRVLRAIRATGATDSMEAVESIGVNLLVVDPTCGDPHQVNAVVRAYVEGGPRECPAALRGS